MKKVIALASVVVALAGCDGATGPGGTVAVKFSTSTGPRVSASLLSAGGRGISADELTVTGTNGNIVLQDVRFIVEQMKLSSSESSSVCGDDEDEIENETDDDLRVSFDDRSSGASASDDDDECEFKGGPFIVDLSLDGNTTVTTESVPPGTYDSFRFKIDDLEGDDEDDASEKTKAPDVLAQMRTAYPDFPARASMVVKGTQDGQPFTVYFRSKMKIRQQISPPLVVPGSQALTVRIDPSEWFKSGAQVMNLVALNGKLVEFSEQFGRGMKGTRRGDD